jgi:hypothetical protein
MVIEQRWNCRHGTEAQVILLRKAKETRSSSSNERSITGITEYTAFIAFRSNHGNEICPEGHKNHMFVSPKPQRS